MLIRKISNFGIIKLLWKVYFTHYKILTSTVIALFYLASNLQFLYTLDDSVNYINALRTVGVLNIFDTLKFIGHAILTPPPADSLFQVFRPLRMAYTFLAFKLSIFIPWFPDILNALTVGICAYILLHFAELSGLSRRVAVCSIVWFFASIPIVAMGQVKLVSQFIVISGIYLGIIFYYLYVSYRKPIWLGYSALTIVLFSFYAEAILISVLGISICGAIYIVKKQYRLGIVSLLFSLVVGLMVTGNAFIVTLDTGQFSKIITNVLSIRGYDLSNTSDKSLFTILDALSYRDSIFTGIFFSISPYLFIFSFTVFFYLLIVNRNKLWAMGFGVVILFIMTGNSIGIMNVNTGIGIVIVFISLYYAMRHPLIVSILLAGLILLGPIFIIDVHASYLLPALIFLVFKVVFDAYNSLVKPYARLAFLGLAIILPVILFSNFVSGAYFAASVANDNKQMASEFKTILDDGIVLTNFRHIFDLYMYTNIGREPTNYKEEVFFTATVPLYDNSRRVHTEEDFKQWILTNKDKGKPMYFFIVDHNRLPGKIPFHAPRFLNNSICSKKYVGSHIFDASVPFIDPGYLLTPYFYRHGLSAGFIAYPIPPDMIDDIGVEYGFFVKRLFASYRIFKVDCDLNQNKNANQWIPEGPIEEVREYNGFDILLVNGRYFAIPNAEGVFELDKALSKGYSKTFISDNYNEVIAEIDKV